MKIMTGTLFPFRLLQIAPMVCFLMVLLILNSCGPQNSDAHDYIPSPVSTDISHEVTKASPTSFPNLSDGASQTPTSLSPTIVGTPQESIASSIIEATPGVPILLTGWIRYQSDGVGYRIAYPQSWQLQKNLEEGGVGKREHVSFRSPETGSEVIVDVWEITTPDFDFLGWINSNSESILYDRLGEPVTYNAVIMEQQAVFHFHPSGWGTRDVSMLLFTTEEYCFRILFNSATMPVAKAEPYIFLYMLENFSLPEHPASGISIPTGWEKGAGLITIIDPPKPTSSDLHLDENQYELIGTVENWNDIPGEIHFTLHTDEGSQYSIFGESFRVHFRGLPIDYNYNVHIPRPQRGDRVRVAGRPLVSGEVLAEYIAIERNGEWQPWFYKTLFNTTTDEFNPIFLSNFGDSDSETVYIWLQGSLRLTLPLLIDDQGQPIKARDWLQYLEQDTLAYGKLRADKDFRIELYDLYVQDGLCTFSDMKQYCHSWQKIYPHVSAMEPFNITIMNLISETRVIVPQLPVEGIVTITLASNGQVFAANGEAVSWDNLAIGARIQAIGEIGEAGTLVAEEIHINTGKQ